MVAGGMNMREIVDVGIRIGRGVIRFFVTAFLLATLAIFTVGIPPSDTAIGVAGITIMTISLVNAFVMDWREEGYSRFSLRTLLFVAVPIVAVVALFISFISKIQPEQVLRANPPSPALPAEGRGPNHN
jgi:hypothetical protein